MQREVDREGGPNDKYVCDCITFEIRVCGSMQDFLCIPVCFYFPIVYIVLGF